MQTLKRLPGLGYRSAEKVALHLLVENTSASAALIESLNQAKALLGPCEVCGNLAEEKLCSLCRSDDRDHSQICVAKKESPISLPWNGLVYFEVCTMYFMVNLPGTRGWSRTTQFELIGESVKNGRGQRSDSCPGE